MNFWIKIGIGVVSAFLLGFIALITFDPLTYNNTYIFFRSGWIYLLILLLLGGAMGYFGRKAYIAYDDKAYNERLSFKGKLSIVLGATSLVAMLVALTVVAQVRDWQVNNTYASILEETSEQPNFGERVPWEVADYSANSAMSGINADRLTTDYLPYADTYTTVAEQRGTLGFFGYEAVIQQGFNLDGGVSENSQCSFSEEADRRLGAPFMTSLDRLILREDRHLLFERDDAWAYCDEEEVPHVVVPLTKLEGVLNLHHVPAGVAVYNGGNGDIEIVENTTDVDFDGPAIGLSYADKIVDSMRFYDNSGGVSGWWEVKGEQSTGFATRSLANLQLPFADGESTHVTGLTRVSSATSVERLLTIQSNEVTSGEHPEMKMWLLDPVREANDVIDQDIRSTYDEVNWASGLTVQEIAPGPEGGWVASIGQRAVVVYRVTMDRDGNWTIRDLRTGDEQELDADEVGEEGAVPDEGGADSGSIDVDIDTPLDEMTPAELAELGEAVLNELAERGNE